MKTALIIMGVLILGIAIYLDQRKKGKWKVSLPDKKNWKLLLGIAGAIALCVIMFMVWKWSPDDQPSNTPFIPKTVTTTRIVPSNFLIRDSSRIWTKGTEYTFNYDRTTYFTPDKPGKIHLYCWNDKSHWEMVTIRSADLKLHDTMYNSTSERVSGIYSVKLMGDSADSIAVTFTNTKE